MQAATDSPPTPTRAIAGTAGHIDHGKTELVRALTGIDTDRLPEEKARGISIELGFAHLDLPGLGRVGIVDVPGHERFIRQMLAGAHGFDLVLVTVAADDGVMPQTEEHFDIVHLLGVRRAVFVLTKCDLVSPERVDEVRGEIEILAVGTAFEHAPVVAVSARTGAGISDLRNAIAASLAGLEPRPVEGALRIPVDRVFVVKGHGVVVTGTALDGQVCVGDEVALLPDHFAAAPGPVRPASRIARVREIQVHGERVTTALAGQRVALNLAGIEKDELARGDTVASPGGGVRATARLDARVEVRPAAGRAIASHVRVRVHHGTRETLARLVWLDGLAEVAPRRSGFAQLALDDALVALPGDRFVLRDETAARTIGGGVVLSAHATRHRRAQGDVSPSLRALEDDDAATRLAAALELSQAFGLDAAAAAAATGLGASEVVALASTRSSAADGRSGSAAGPPASGAIAVGDAQTGAITLGDPDTGALLVSAKRFAAFSAGLLAEVTRYQAAHANLPGVDLEHLRGACRPLLDAKVFRLVVDRLERSGSIVRAGSVVRTRDHAASLGRADEAVATRMIALVRAAGFMPPVVKDLANELGVDPARVTRIAHVLVLRRELVRITPELFFSCASLDQVREKLTAHLRQHREITPAEFRDLIAASRKFCIPLLDWFDREGLTLRVGDLRRLRQS
jgi:selenocysteine-specific elongation factor